MINIEFISHKDCDQNLKIEICKFKNLNWPYSIDEHLNWMAINLQPNDVHLLLRVDKELVAYMNLVQLELELDNIAHVGLGIGNVCVSPAYKGKYYGRLIMSVADFFARQQNKLAILLCKEKNIGFYNNCQWIEFVGSFNLKSYNIHLFTNLPIKYNKIFYNREF